MTNYEIKNLPSDNFEKWMAILQKKNRKDFTLYGTRAALAWNNDEWVKDVYEVVVVCINHFINGVPASRSEYDNFIFYLNDWRWEGWKPKGELHP